MHVCLLDGGYVTEGVGSLFSTPKFGEIELLIQEEPTKEEQVIHEEIKATMPVYQSAAVDALRSFSREKGETKRYFLSWQLLFTGKCLHQNTFSCLLLIWSRLKKLRW